MEPARHKSSLFPFPASKAGDAAAVLAHAGARLLGVFPVTLGSLESEAAGNGAGCCRPGGF